MKPAFIFPLLLIAAAFGCRKPSIDTAYTWEEYANPVLYETGIRDTLPAFKKVKLKQLNGVAASYTSDKRTFYFKYESDAEEIIRTISMLPFRKSNAVSDTLCRVMDMPFSLSGREILSHDEVMKAGFFWNIKPEDYTYYECIKAPERHTILVNKKNKTILHRIEINS